jgi:hypothetical protein
VSMLPLQNFAALVQAMAATMQGTCSALVDLTVGSVLRSVIEANAAVALWLQWLIVRVLAMTRLATSSGTDVDSFVGDFGLLRLPASAASGYVTLSRFIAGIATLVPPGTLVKTASGTVFSVTSAAQESAWSAAQGGYVLPAMAISVDVAVTAQVAGSSGNVTAASINLLGSAIAGIDSVTNAQPLAGGFDAESDAALRLRFQGYIASLREATLIAVENAIASVQQGLTWLVQENVNQDGTNNPGHFCITIDDGSGNPPPTLLTSVYRAVDQIRPVGSSFSLYPPTIVPATIAMSLGLAPAAPRTVLAGQVAQAVLSFVEALPIGQILPLTRLAQIAYDLDARIINVYSLSINGGTGDLNPGPTGAARILSGLAGIVVS